MHEIDKNGIQYHVNTQAIRLFELIATRANMHELYLSPANDARLKKVLSAEIARLSKDIEDGLNMLD